MTFWQKHAVKMTVKSLIPFGGTLRRIKRAIAPTPTDAANDEARLDDALEQIFQLRKAGISVDGARVLEIGTGWFPILPLVYRAYGASSVVTVDQVRLMDRRTLQHSMDYIEKNIERIAKRHHQESWPQISYRSNSDSEDNLDDQLARLGMIYRAPSNFMKEPMNSADLIVSRDVLEHIPENLLNHLCEHMFRVLRPGGTVCHMIDMSDHWQHSDKSISRIEFLAHRGLFWTTINSRPDLYQNRLRRKEYLEIFHRAGFEIIFANGVPDPGATQAALRLPLIDRYKNWDAQELGILGMTLIARKPH